jgi:hypothetical protein
MICVLHAIPAGAIGGSCHESRIMDSTIGIAGYLK